MVENPRGVQNPELLPHPETVDRSQNNLDITARVIKDADRLIPRSSQKELPMQVKALRERPAIYPERFAVAPGTTWETLDRSTYHPKDFTVPSLLTKPKSRTDPEDPRKVAHFSSYQEAVKLDKDGRPLNPMGPTGIRGRGKLHKWGANFAADPIVTRISPEGKLEMIVIQRTDSKEWAIPGGMVDKEELVTATLKRELAEETGADLDFDKARSVYKGGADDRRNTDNAWIETDAYHLHLVKDTNLAFKAQAGEALDVRWMPIIQEELGKLYASHAHFVKLAVKDWEGQTGFVLDRNGNIGISENMDKASQNQGPENPE
jgi:ADP-ribose pyrophosphatase